MRALALLLLLPLPSFAAPAAEVPERYRGGGGTAAEVPERYRGGGGTAAEMRERYRGGGGTASCRVTEGSEAFAPFVGGKLVFQLETGHAVLHKDGASLELVGPETTSTFGAPSGTCRFRWDKILSGGRLRALLFYFSDCTYQDPEPLHSGYVDVRSGFDLKDASGSYAEMQRNGYGSRSNRLSLEGCAVTE